MIQQGTPATQKLNPSTIAVVLFFGVAGTIQYHLAQFLTGFDRFFGDRGDARGFLYYCEHWYLTLSGKASLLSPEVFYPTKHTLAYSDILLGVGVPYSFFRALGVDMFMSLELVMFLIAFFSYCTAFWLLYKTLGFRLAPSIIGAMFFAFNSPKFFQLIHLQLQFVVLLPVIFALLISFARQVETLDQRRATILLSVSALCWDLQIATALYFAWFFVLWVTFFMVLALLVGRTRRFIIAVVRKFWRAIAIATAVLIVFFLPTLLLYLPLAKPDKWYIYEGIINLIPDWHAILSMGAGNYVWGRITLALLPDPIPNTWGELQVGIGLFSSAMWIVLTIASFWIIATHRKANASSSQSSTSVLNARQLGMLFLACLILATSLFYVFGFRYGDHSPWYLIYRFFPGGGAIRGVSRYVIFLTLPIAIAFAYVINRGLEYAAHESTPLRRKAIRAALLLLGGLFVFEQFGVPKIGATGFSVKLEKVYLSTMAARLTKDCQAFYLAPGALAKRSMPEYQYDAMLISAMTDIPTLNASSSQFPKDWDLYQIKEPNYEEKVKSWVAINGLKGKICRLETGPEIDAFDAAYPNPINDPQIFVRQLYRDIIFAEPTAETVAPQIEKLSNCGVSDQDCQAQTALNIMLSTGYIERGSLLVQMYQTGLGRMPHYDEFVNDMKRFADYSKTMTLQAASERMLADFAAANTQVNVEDLRKVVGSDDLNRKLQTRSFVALNYFALMRREPDEVGLMSWSDLLDRRGDLLVVTKGMLTSAEYRQRLEVSRLQSARLDGSDQRFSHSISLVARQHVIAAHPSHLGASLFGG